MAQFVNQESDSVNENIFVQIDNLGGVYCDVPQVIEQKIKDINENG